MTTNREKNDQRLDFRQRFVRITGRRPDGFVEFDFAVGEPEVFVEMILPLEAFKEFCRENKVEILSEDHASTQADREEWDWRLSDATGTRFK